MAMKTKSFDCVAMKREGSRLIYEQVRNMTPEQELAWWKAREAEARKRLQSAAGKQPETASR